MNRYRKLHHSFFYRQSPGLIVSTILLALLVYPAWRTLAAPGDLDMSFSGDGKWSSSGHYYAYVKDIRIQIAPNPPYEEKIIVPITQNYPEGLWFLVTPPGTVCVSRLDASGELDSSFGNNGYACLTFYDLGLGSYRPLVTAIELQNDRKILVAGTLHYIGGGSSLAYLARFTADGAPDPTFGNNGRFFYVAQSEVKDMAVQANNGKIILAGRWKPNPSSNWRSAIWRFNANGTLDSSFVSSGLFDTVIAPGNADDAGGFVSVYVQPDGKIVALANYQGYRLRRVTASGNLDISLFVNSTAGERGVTIHPVGPNIWIVGYKTIQGVNYGAVYARNSNNGAVDNTFSGGLGVIQAMQPSVWTDATLEPFSSPTKYIISGWNTISTANPTFATRATVSRLFSTGLLDTSFSQDGYTETGFQNDSGDPIKYSKYNSVRCGLSGKIVAAGEASNQEEDFPPIDIRWRAIARYWNN